MKHQLPKLTLGILNFNSSIFLESLFSSIEQQTCKSFNVTILDNGSTDNSWSQITSFKDSIKIKLPNLYVDIFRNGQNNFSLHGTRQLIDMCKTEYISIVHADDILDSHYVELISDAINRFPSVAAFNVDLTEIDKDGITTSKILTSNWTRFDCVNRLLVSGLNPGLMPGSVIRTSSAMTFLNTAFPRSLNGNEDTILWLTLARDAFSIRRIPQTIYFYRRHEKQTTNSLSMFAFSLGFSRKYNIQTAKNNFEKFLAQSEIRWESNNAIKETYFEALNPFTTHSKTWFRPVSIAIRRFSRLLNFFGI